MIHLLPHIVTTLAAVIDPNDIKAPKQPFGASTISMILQIVFGFAGAIAFLIITIAGFRYVISQGKPQEVAKAKDTIIYALVGLVICMIAFSIVKFVLSRV